MVKEWYKIIKESPDMLLDNDEILSFYPDYYKVREKIETDSVELPMINKTIAYFNANYKTSDRYKELKENGLNEEEIYNSMLKDTTDKYNRLYKSVLKAKDKCIDLCDLIDYIGHYPERYPRPRPEEQNEKLEKLMDKYDIAVAYHSDGLSAYRLKITSGDMVRLIETLKSKVKIFDLQRVYLESYRWAFNTDKLEEIEEKHENLEEAIEDFPKSIEQLNGTTKKEEIQKQLVKKMENMKLGNILYF